MDTQVKSVIKNQLANMTESYLNALCEDLGIDTDDYSEITEALLEQQITADKHGIVIREEQGIVDYISSKLDDLNVFEAQQIVASYFDDEDVVESEHDSALVVITEPSGEKTVRGVCDFLYDNIEYLSSSQLEDIVVRFLSYEDVVVSEFDTSIVLVKV